MSDAYRPDGEKMSSPKEMFASFRKHDVMRCAPCFYSGSHFQRQELLFVTLAVVIAGASLPTVHSAIDELGVSGAIMAAFKISAIVWAAYWLGLRSIATSGEVAVASRLDKVVCLSAIVLCFFPLGGALWVVLFAMGAYIIFTSGDNKELNNAGWVFIAVTVPTFWGRRLFNFFSDFILQIDASFVSMLTKTERIGNVVRMPGGEGSVVIGAPCSSMANVSLGVLCWILFSRYAIRRWSIYNVMWCTLVVVSIMSINVIRITIISYFPQYYAFLHDGGGVIVFSYLSALAAIGFSYLGVLHVNSRQN